jgi:hypothetical protein
MEVERLFSDNSVIFTINNYLHSFPRNNSTRLPARSFNVRWTSNCYKGIVGVYLLDWRESMGRTNWQDGGQMGLVRLVTPSSPTHSSTMIPGQSIDWKYYIFVIDYSQECTSVNQDCFSMWYGG